MKKNLFICLVTGLCLYAASHFAAAGEKIVVCGTGDSQELLRTLAGAYTMSHPGTEIDVPDSIGSIGGIKETAMGNCDLGRIARPLKDNEKDLGLDSKFFATSPVVFAVNHNVKNIDDLTSSQIVAIYSGDYTEWSRVGGEKTKIYVANREKGDSSRSVIEKNVPGFRGIAELAGKTLFNTPETIETISRFDNTIGYTSMASAKEAGLKVLKVNGVYPSSENVASGSYPLASPFGIIWKGELKGTAKSFVQYLYSPEAKKIIMKNGAFPADR